MRITDGLSSARALERELVSSSAATSQRKMV
jgi:hypothetical protein